MAEVKRWRDTDHLDRAVETAGGQDAFDAAMGAMLAEARGWRLAEMRKRRGMTQEQVANRMGVSVARVSQIENGCGRVPSETMEGWAQALAVPPDIFARRLLSFYDPELHRDRVA